MPDVIQFYFVGARYGELSNFAPFPIKLDGKRWPTSEHYFQAQKFRGTPYADEIRRVRKPKLAAEMGRDRSQPLRRDWESVKESVMLTALRAKFTQHPDLHQLLLETGDAILVEHTANDTYWGDGGDGSGKNRLGYLLMQLREELRQGRNHIMIERPRTLVQLETKFYEISRDLEEWREEARKWAQEHKIVVEEPPSPKAFFAALRQHD